MIWQNTLLQKLSIIRKFIKFFEAVWKCKVYGEIAKRQSLAF